MCHADPHRIMILEHVHEAANSRRPAVEHVGGGHGRGDVGVTEKSLDGSNVVALLEQVGGEGVAEGVAGSMLCHPSLEHRGPGILLDEGPVEVTAALVPGQRIDPPPGPGACRRNGRVRAQGACRGQARREEAGEGASKDGLIAACEFCRRGRATAECCLAAAVSHEGRDTWW